MHDGRHGHTSKVREPVLHWLESRCSQAPQTPSSAIQKDLQERFGLVVSITHLNRLRAPRGLAYWHTERFLTQVAEVGGAEALTDAFGQWTAQLWQSGVETKQEGSPCFYIDGHRKPVYTDKLIPRGLIGCSGKILGCRALVLLHDEQGHPRLAITARGDQHLTIGLPQVLLRYEQATSGSRMHE